MAQAPGSESDGLGGGEHSAQTRREIVPGSFVRVVCVLVIPRTHAMAGGSRWTAMHMRRPPRRTRKSDLRTVLLVIEKIRSNDKYARLE